MIENPVLTSTRERPLFLKLFPLWLILTSMPLLAFGIGKSLVAQGYDMPNELLYLSWYLSAPLGSSVFSLYEISAIGISTAAIAIGYFFMAGRRTAYWASISLLILGIIVSLWGWPTFGFIYAVPANLGWLWFLRRDKETCDLFSK